MMVRALVASCLVALAPQTFAQNLDQDALTWLQRMHQAARNLNYSGVFVYESNGRTETSRITHIADATGEYEKLEALDGPPREVVRQRDEVRAYLPKSRQLILDRVGMARFPGRMISAGVTLGDHYVMRVAGVARVAGRDAVQISLYPRDDMRYGHQLWADKDTGLLLKARMVDTRTEPLEEFGFSEVTLDVAPERDKVKSRFTDVSDWEVINARGVDVRTSDVGWIFRDLPPGFRKVSLTRRPLHKDTPEAFHAVFSDGLVSISVFIESAAARGGVTPTPSTAGSIGIFKRMNADHMIVALGEVPMAALRRVAEGVEPRKR